VSGVPSAGEAGGRYVLVVPQQPPDDVVDLADLARRILAGWRLSVALAVICGLAAWGISTMLPRSYRAEVLVAPAGPSGLAGGMPSGLGGLAALAGVELGDGAARTQEYIATLGSDGLARTFIADQNLLPVLFAQRWDPAAKAWRPGESTPTLEEGVRLFTRSVVSVELDRKTNLVTLGVRWRAPDVAAAWANSYVARANERLRIEAIREAERSREFLRAELARTSVLETQQAIHRLIQEQINTIMLANVRRDYAFRVIDAAVAPEVPVSPKVPVLVLGGVLFGLALGSARAILRWHT
jgi:uncharacterized protein involved in exopolysaccharide biosynthesis